MDHRLRHMITARDLEPLLKDLARAMGAPMRVEDPGGLDILTLGPTPTDPLPDAGTAPGTVHDVVLDGDVLGRVRGGPPAKAMAGLLAHLASRERGGLALRAAHDRISEDVSLLARLQRKLLPRDPPDLPGMTVRTVHLPTGMGSGDACDHFAVRHGLRAMVADVAGHGARAAFVMAIVQTLFRTTEDLDLPLADTIILINYRLRRIFTGETDFVTMFAAEYDRETGELAYVNAGHCPGLLRVDGEVAGLPAMTPPLGFFELDLAPRRAAMPPGSALLLYTDGLYEWEMPGGGFFGQERFRDLAAEAMSGPGFSPRALVERLEGLGFEPGRHDDATLLWLETKPAPPGGPDEAGR